MHMDGFLEITLKTLKPLKAMKNREIINTGKSMKRKIRRVKGKQRTEIAFNVFIVYFGGKKTLEQGTELILSDTHITQETQSYCTIKK